MVRRHFRQLNHWPVKNDPQKEALQEEAFLINSRPNIRVGLQKVNSYHLNGAKTR
jgi:hypothetical protein